jgi:hypothetical protein
VSSDTIVSCRNLPDKDGDVLSDLALSNSVQYSNELAFHIHTMHAVVGALVMVGWSVLRSAWRFMYGIRAADFRFQTSDETSDP